MPGASLEFEETDSQSVSYKEKSDDSCSTSKSSSCDTPCESYDAQKIALWIVAFILILIWTVVLFGAFAGGWGKKDDCDDDGKHSGWGLGGFAVGFLIWIIFIVIFFAAIAWCGWIAILFFFILTILIVGVGCWGMWGGKKSHKSDC